MFFQQIIVFQIRYRHLFPQFIVDIPADEYSDKLHVLRVEVYLHSVALVDGLYYFLAFGQVVAQLEQGIFVERVFLQHIDSAARFPVRAFADTHLALDDLRSSSLRMDGLSIR